MSSLWAKMELRNKYFTIRRLSPFQLGVHILSLIPFALLLIDAVQGDLTVNPIQAIMLRTGKYALIFLLLCLACSPLNSYFGFRSALKVRRTLGLYSFFYASLHFLNFILLDYGLDLKLIREAIFEKRFALIGFSAFLILVLLAMTSTQYWKKRLGKRWKKIHRLIYLAGILVIVHYMWSVKSDIRIPILYGGILLLLLILRLPRVRFVVKHSSMTVRKIIRDLVKPSKNSFRAQVSPNDEGGETVT